MSRKFKSILDFLNALNDLYGSEYSDLAHTCENINKCTEEEKYINIFDKFCDTHRDQIKTQTISDQSNFTFEFIEGVKVPLGKIITDKSDEPENISTIWKHLQKIAGVVVNREMIFINNLAREIHSNKDIMSLSGDPSKILTDGSFQNIIAKLTTSVISGFQTENLNIHSMISAIQDMLPPQ